MNFAAQTLLQLLLGILAVSNSYANHQSCPNLPFKGKVVLATGGSSGIGADAARHLARLGASVAIVGRNVTRLRAVRDQIIQYGLAAPLAIVADVRTDTERIVVETIKRFGKLDVLLNVAGIARSDNAVNVTMSEFEEIFDTNARSVVRLTQLCVPYLEQTKGNVVCVSSVAGLRPIANQMSYCISKAAVSSFTKSAALDLAPKGIRVNAINPGAIRTPLFGKLGWSPDEVEKFFESFQWKYPLGRVGEVSDTSAAIAFLADNEKASFITGIQLPVDGGALVGGILI